VKFSSDQASRQEGYVSAGTPYAVYLHNDTGKWEGEMPTFCRHLPRKQRTSSEVRRRDPPSRTVRPRLIVAGVGGYSRRAVTCATPASVGLADRARSRAESSSSHIVDEEAVLMKGGSRRM
jgi:hypothetical protein